MPRTFASGYSKIHHDETRHVGYGVWFLREAAREDEDAADVIRETLSDLLPAVAESLSPLQKQPRRRRPLLTKS